MLLKMKVLMLNLLLMGADPWLDLPAAGLQAKHLLMGPSLYLATSFFPTNRLCFAKFSV